MSYARAILLGLGLASGCTGETFDLLPLTQTRAGAGGGAGELPLGGSAGAGGKGGSAGTSGVPPQEAGNSGWSGECPSGNCFPYCQKDADCGFGVCLLSQSFGRCVECLEEEHCPRDDENCDPVTNSCMVACTPEDESDEATRNCPGSRPQCSDSRNVCVECLWREHCTGSVKKQCSWDNRCVECRFNRDCSNPSPVCETNYAAEFEVYACRPCLADYECGEERDCVNGSCKAFETSPEP
jgi:hypothetical protein